LERTSLSPSPLPESGGFAIVWAVSGEQGMSREPWANIHEPWAKKVLLLVQRKSLTTKWKNYEWIETFVQGWQFSNLTLQGQTCNLILNTLSKMWRLKLEYPITGHLRNCTRKWRVGFELLMDIVRLWGIHFIWNVNLSFTTFLRRLWDVE
jgi:hypothetical protein